MGPNPYQPFSVEQKNQQKEAAAAGEKNPFADPGWGDSKATTQNASWQDVHLDPSHAGTTGASQAATGAKGAGDKPPAWAYAAAEPTWEAPAQSTPALGSTTHPPQSAPAYYGTGPPEFSGQTIYNVNQDGVTEKRSYNILDWWLFGLGFFTGITWLVGAFLPYCRNPRHPTPSHKSAHLANGIASVILVIVIIIAVGFAARNGKDYYNGNCCGVTWAGSCYPCYP